MPETSVPNYNNNALVSIIIPAYNTAPYIHRAIESSLRQTHSNVEVIVIDDGSTDETLRVAQGYADNDTRIRIFHQENKGVSSARNLGIREMKGDYVIFLDSDDWLEDDAAEVFLDAQAKYPDKTISSRVSMIRFDKKNTTILNRLKNGQDTQYVTHYNIEETIYAFSKSAYLCTPATKILKANIVRQNNLQFLEWLHYGEDQVFMLEYLCKTSGTVLLERCLINIVERSDSAERISYDKRKVFIGDHFNDYAQIMIDNVESSKLKTLLKVHYTKKMMFEMVKAFKTKATRNKIIKVKEKIRNYQNEYLSSTKIPYKEKAKFFVFAYFPIPIAKCICISWNYAKLAIRTLIPEKREIIPYW